MKNASGVTSGLQRNKITDRLPPGPLILLLIPYGAGILLSWKLTPAPYVLFSMLVLSGVGAFGFHMLDRRYAFSLALFLFVFVAGSTRLHLATTHDPHSTMHLPENTIVTATGHLSSVEQKVKTTPDGKAINWSSATLRVHRIRIRDNEFSANGTLQLYTFRKPAPYRPGMRIRVEGMIHKNRPPTNPGSTSWRWYRHQQEIGGSLVVQTPEDWQLRPAKTRCLPGHVAALRHWIVEQMNVNQQRLRLLPALILGMREQVDSDLEETFQRSGTVHFLAVSGLHVGFLVLGGYFLLRTLRCSPRMTTVLLLVLLTVYLGLTGFRLPTLRASIMIGLLLVGIMSRRHLGSLQLLGIAAWILLIYHPLDLLSPGFHFSFLSVAGLILLSGPLGITAQPEEPAAKQRLLREFLFIERLKGYLYQGMRYGLSVVGATALVLLVVGPLIVYHFNIISPGSLIANPLLFITLPLLLAFGFLHMTLAILSGIGLPLLSGLLQLSSYLLQGLETGTIQICTLVTEIPGSHLYLPEPNIPFVLTYYLLLVALWWFHVHLPRPRRSLWIGGILCFIALLSTGYVRTSVPEDRASVTMLDVGHGTSMILTDTSKHRILYDCGSTGYSNPGTWVTAPALWREGTGTIDVLILSHSDLDHVSGVRALSDRFKIRRVWVSPFFHRHETGEALVEHFRNRGVPVETVSAGDRLKLGDTRLTVKSPPRSFGNESDSSPLPTPNASSLVVEVLMAGRRVLLPGDIEGIGKRWFERNSSGMKNVDLFQVPHHGGSGSARNPLSVVDGAKYALISAGKGTVSQKLVRRFKDQNMQVFNTANDGAVQIRWRDGNTEMRAFQWAEHTWQPKSTGLREPQE